MKTIVTIALILTCLACSAQEVLDDHHKPLCYIRENGLVETRSHKVLGYITPTIIETPERVIVGYIDGSIIEDVNHNLVGIIRKSSIQGRELMNIGYIKNNTILDDEHEIIGYFTNVDPKLVAIYFFFFN